MNKLLIFAKSPIKGKVKTRLKEDTPLTDDDILKLYTAFLKDTIVAASLSKAQRIYIAYYPEDSRDGMIDIIKGVKGSRGQGGSRRLYACGFNAPVKGAATVELFPQSGKDFDVRLTNALRYISPHPPPTPIHRCGGRGKRGGDNIVILGSDSPHIQPDTINKAFRFLSAPPPPPFVRGGCWGGSGAMVLGPSGEGGVYLIGGKKGFDFNGVFTSGNESDNLLKIARRKKLPLLILEELTDVDVKSDLITLVSNLSMMKYSSNYTNIYLPQYTLKAIKELGLTVNRKGNETRAKYLSLNKFPQ